MNTTLCALPLLSTLFLASCVASQGGQPAAQQAESGDKEQDELRQKKHGLASAELKLSITRLQAQSGEVSAAHSIAMAEADVALAKQALEGAQRSIAIEEGEVALNLERAQQRALEAEQELAELEAMYAAEEFANTTKELVLTRGRANLEMSKKSLELAKRRADEQRNREFPRRLEESKLALAKAERGLAEARESAERGALERKLSLLEAEHAQEDLKRELAELEKKSAPGGTAAPASATP
jgi:hypothetical protein